MNGTTRHSAAARTRAFVRLRSITIGTTVMGLAGVAGFGTIAAISYSGNPATAAAADGGTTGAGPTGAGSTDQTTTTTTTTTRSKQLTPAATPIPTTTHTRAHVTTGGSG